MAQRLNGISSVPDESRSTTPDTDAIRSFAEASAAAIAVVAGPAHRVLYANPALRAAAGRLGDTLAGLPLCEAFPHLAGDVAVLDRFRAAGGPSRVWRGHPLRLRPDEGEPRFWDVEATPFRTAAGVPTGLLLQLRDVSAQRRTEAALEEALAAQQATARVAEHRIKNSLQLVASLLRLQSAQVTEPAGRAAVEAATARVLAVAEAHRALQRSPDLRTVRLSDLLDELAAGVAVQHPGTDLRTGVEEGLALDAERAIPLALVLAELVEGAVRRAAATSAPPEPMRLHARRQGDALLLELNDAGAAEEEQDASGLGEKVVRALTRQIGAALSVERLPGEGRRRTVLSLPAEPAQPARD